MFESAELGHCIDKKTWHQEVPALREALLAAQYALLDKKHRAVVILLAGMEGAGKSETVNLLNEWMDPRHIRTRAFGKRTDEERERPHMWRFWRQLPPKGHIGIFFGSWYTWPVLHRTAGKLSGAALDQHLEDIRHFEEMLAREGVLLIKFWFHLSKKSQKKRLEETRKDPDTRWRITKQDQVLLKKYDRFYKTADHVLRETSTGHSPWTVIEGVDHRYRSLTAGKLLLNVLQQALVDKESAGATLPENTAAALQPTLDGKNVLTALSSGKAISKKKYATELEQLQGKLNQLSRHQKFNDRSCVCVFEGQDAAGKGGAIRRVRQALDARFYDIIRVAAPTEEERAQPWLWRFWRHLPQHSHFTIFDRSHYGRVLVERVEGLCSEADWMRAYAEINDFEQQMARSGIILAKFWLSITPDEQLRRFRERENTAYKRHKITAEDWRNREKWPQYERAVCDMIDRTSTDIAPWTLIQANDKYHARLKILTTLCEHLEQAIAI